MEKIKALNDAIKILDKARRATCRDAQAIFAKVLHAQRYLDKQIAELLSE